MVTKSRLNKLINVSNNRYGIDTHYVTTSGNKGMIIGSYKKDVIDRVQNWFETKELKTAMLCSIHGPKVYIDFENETINGVNVYEK